MSKMIDEIMNMGCITPTPFREYVLREKVIEIIRKHEQPVSGGVDADVAWENFKKMNDDRLAAIKQPTPADETLSDVRQVISSLETAVREIIHTSGVLPLLTELEQALSQPSKPAMTREELVELVANAIKYEINCSGRSRGNRSLVERRMQGALIISDKAITALDEAGVLTIKE